MNENYSGNILAWRRNIFVSGDIDYPLVGQFLAFLKEIDSRPGNINIYISSLGGMTEAGLGMYMGMMQAKNNITTYAMGAAYSAAVILFLGGDVRVMSNQSTLFLHDGIVEITETTLQNAIVNVKEAERIINLYASVVSERTGLTMSNVLDMCKKDTYLSGKQALELNFATKIEG